jgi:hypothetical protein
MLRLWILTISATAAMADGFTFNIGGPVASQDFRMKGAVFVFRTQGCSDPARVQVSGTAEGILQGTRRSVALKIVTTAQPNVYGVFQNWPAAGDWVVNLKGACGDANAGAIIPIGPKGFIRESSKLLSRSATPEEVETVLKGVNK